MGTSQTLDILVGTVEEITFQNEDSGFTVLHLTDAKEGDDVCVVGTLPGVSIGEELKLTGQFTTHPVYGRQFKAELFERHMPAQANAIYRYLASGVIKGIRSSTARKIVDHFGDDTLKILEEDPSRLSEVKGISEKKAAEYIKGFRELFAVRTLMMFLSGYGVTPMQSVTIWKMWGPSARERIISNPYILCDPEFSVSFATADAIAFDYGMSKESAARLLAGIVFVLNHNTGNGHTCLPKDRLVAGAAKLVDQPVERLEETLLSGLEQEVLYAVQDSKKAYIFLPQYYTAETYITARLHHMLAMPVKEDKDISHMIAEIEAQHGISYETLQKSAILEAYKNQLFILTGGPGTGKTTTLNGIIALFEKMDLQVLLAAPTGRAAKRLTEITDKDATTIHRLLEVDFSSEEKLSFVRDEGYPLDADVVIVDEMSMMDTLLFESLLHALPPGCKLIMVGDFHQLPSVGAGNVLHDLLGCGLIPTVELKQIFRQAAESLIITNAHSIVHGEMPQLDTKDNDFFFITSPNATAAKQKIVDLYATRLPRSYGYSPFEQIQVLCPQRKGECGVIELNKALQLVLNPNAKGKVECKNGFYSFFEGDKVMQIKNNYNIGWDKDADHGVGIFNGDIGIIKMVDVGSKTLEISFDGRVAYYSFDMANELELAYAITVHKSQGSEFDAIILPILGGFDKLYYRNLLYTAVTRAKKMIVLVGSRNRIKYMVDNNLRMLRYTGLRFFLTEQAEGSNGG